MTTPSATRAAQASGKMYHLGLGAGDLAERILLVGDPARVERVVTRFENVRFRSQHREFVAATGKFKGLDISVLGTGIGQDNTEIAVIEACQITKQPAFLRCGTTGSLTSKINIGDLIITKGALRLEGTTKFYVHESYPAIADLECTMALASSSFELKKSFHLGLTASASGFYGAQGREIEGFPVRFPNLPTELAQQGILNFEMESATLFVLAALRGLRAGAICGVVAVRPTDQFATETQLMQTEESCIDFAMNAFHVLTRMDKVRGDKSMSVWTPQV